MISAVPCDDPFYILSSILSCVLLHSFLTVLATTRLKIITKCTHTVFEKQDLRYIIHAIKISPKTKTRDISTIYLRLIVISNLLIALPAGCTTCACKKKTNNTDVSNTDIIIYYLLFFQFQQMTLHFRYNTYLC